MAEIDWKHVAVTLVGNLVEPRQLSHLTDDERAALVVALNEKLAAFGGVPELLRTKVDQSGGWVSGSCSMYTTDNNEFETLEELDAAVDAIPDGHVDARYGQLMHGVNIRLTRDHGSE